MLLGTRLALLLSIGAPALAQTPGLVPLNDLGTGTYNGAEGGLYPGGVNVPPLPHLDAAMSAAARVVPRDPAGQPHPQGAIVLLAIGMSNTNQEFAVFERTEDADPDRNGRLVLVDGAVGGQDAATIANPSAAYWNVVSQRLAAMGLGASQVQVVWLKEANQGAWTGFPSWAQTLRDDLEAIVANLHDEFPNLKLCYLSSRIYGGWGGAGEPKAYESAFAVKWLIEDQIAGDPALNHDPALGAVEAPLLLWGPYLWANGSTPRSDGLTWEPADLESDHTHPSPSGEQKVAALLSAFFDAEPTAAAWWPRRSDVSLLALETTKDAHVSAASPFANFGGALQLEVAGGASPARAYVGFDVSSLGAPVLRAKLSLRVPTAASGGGTVSLASDTSWTESSITWSNAPPPGSTLASVPQSSRDGTLAAAVTGAVNADADGRVDVVLSAVGASQTAYHSREAGQPPRLSLAVSCSNGGPPGLSDADSDGVVDACDCAPRDPGIWARPPEVASLRWSTVEWLEWDPAAAQSGIDTRYDVMSGDLADVANRWTGPADLCLVDGSTGTQAQDTAPSPLPGGARFYLVRGDGGCGAGPWERASDGRDRLTAACPGG
jgi:hypothetical protein